MNILPWKSGFRFVTCRFFFVDHSFQLASVCVLCSNFNSWIFSAWNGTKPLKKGMSGKIKKIFVFCSGTSHTVLFQYLKKHCLFHDSWLKHFITSKKYDSFLMKWNHNKRKGDRNSNGFNSSNNTFFVPKVDFFSISGNTYKLEPSR